MIDFHTHILPEIDDGSRNINETIALLQEAKQAGFTKIICTPHYYENLNYVANEKDRESLIRAVSIALGKSETNLQLYSGNEIYVSHEIVELLKEKKASSINDSNYVLFELPFEEEVTGLKDIIFNLIKNNYKPIIAHPERYTFVQKNPNKLLEYINYGVLFQSNYGSIIGQYGKNAKKTVKKLLENNFVHFLGTDSHRPETIYPKVSVALEELEKILPKEEINKLTTYNAKLVLENKPIETKKPIRIKTSFWNR